MAKFNIGDRVVILPPCFDAESFLEDKPEFGGVAGYITNIDTDCFGNPLYSFDVSGDWSREESGLTSADITATILIEGKEIPVRFNRSDLEKLLSVTAESEIPKPEAKKRVTGFERSNTYYASDTCGGVDFVVDYHNFLNGDHYEAANYYSDRTLAEWCNRFDTLNRKMRRWAAEHNSDFEDTFWSIAYSPKLCEVTTYKNNIMNNSCVYFSSPRIADTAIAEFGNQIKWLAENRPQWF